VGLGIWLRGGQECLINEKEREDFPFSISHFSFAIESGANDS
jgi:hypothetical protein